MKKIIPFIALTIFVTVILSLVGCATISRDDSFPPSQQLREADHEKKNSSQGLALYLRAAQSSLDVISDKAASVQNYEKGIQVYNKAVGQCVIALQQKNLKTLNSPLFVKSGGLTYKIEEHTIRELQQYKRLMLVDKNHENRGSSSFKRNGLGAAFIGILDSKVDIQYQPPKGFIKQVTAIAVFGKKSPAGDVVVKFSFIDPLSQKKVTIKNKTFSLAVDFTASQASFYRSNIIRIIGLTMMFHSDETAKKSGVYFLGPYDPKKIPVLFVHGLMSTPLDWGNFINELNANPDFRQHYQAWVFFYPTGMPILLSSIKLRRDLADLASHYPLKKNIVLIGHSMGGIISAMQVTNSGDILSKEILGNDAKKISDSLPEHSILKELLFFKANPYIARVIFIATPHRGSYFAMLPLASLGSMLIKMPQHMFQRPDLATQSVIRKIQNIHHVIPSSISGLSPTSPVLEGVNKLSITVPYHSIIGNRGHKNEPANKSSDGIVSYWSSHLDGAESELLVPAGHEAFGTPEAVAEVLRILHLNNRAVKPHISD